MTMRTEVTGVLEPEKAVEPRRTVAQTMLDYARTVLITLFVAVFLKTFVVEAFRIPSGSMENTLVVGDFLLVNKLAFGLRTPHTLPFTSTRLRSQVLIPMRSVRRGDIVVFEYPGEMGPTDSEGNAHYIKRCIGLPGDTIEIHQRRVFVNGREMSGPPHGKLVALPSGSSRIRAIPGKHGFTEEEFGPVIVPKRGDVIHLNEETFDEWRVFILREGHRIRLGANRLVYVDDRPVSSYSVTHNYFFMLGDNRHNSLDSRFWGFVPEENLVGEALLIYWSWDPDISLLNMLDKVKSIRWGRIGTLVQ